MRNIEFRPYTVATWQDWYWGAYKIYKRTFDGNWNVSYNREEIFTATTLQDAMDFVKAEEGLVT